MVFLKNALMCIYNKVSLYNHGCLPILLLLYIMLAYLMLIAALSNAACLYNAFLLSIFANTFCFMLCQGLLTHSLFISSMIFHHALCFLSKISKNKCVICMCYSSEKLIALNTLH